MTRDLTIFITLIILSIIYIVLTIVGFRTLNSIKPHVGQVLTDDNIKSYKRGTSILLTAVIFVIVICSFATTLASQD